MLTGLCFPTLLKDRLTDNAIKHNQPLLPQSLSSFEEFSKFILHLFILEEGFVHTCKWVLSLHHIVSRDLNSGFWVVFAPPLPPEPSRWHLSLEF